MKQVTTSKSGFTFVKLLKVVGALVLVACFALNVVYAIFSGGEFESVAEDTTVKGLMRISKGEYSTSYIAGDLFSFDKEASEIFLVAKDPAEKELVKIEDLPASDFGFLVNGEGEVIDDPKTIVMNTNITKVTVVSKKYPTLMVDIPVKVINSLGSTQLVSELVYEGEVAQIYESGVLLTQNDLKTRPSANKPYLSSVGSVPDHIYDWSGGAVLRQFQSTDMKIVMEVVCTEACDVQLEIMVCSRKETKAFSGYYKFTLNGEKVQAIDDAIIPEATDGGYFQPYTIPAVTVHFERGVNTLVFESGSKVGTKNPTNFDAVRIIAEKAVLGIYA